MKRAARQTMLLEPTPQAPGREELAEPSRAHERPRASREQVLSMMYVESESADELVGRAKVAAPDGTNHRYWWHRVAGGGDVFEVVLTSEIPATG